LEDFGGEGGKERAHARAVSTSTLVRPNYSGNRSHTIQAVKKDPQREENSKNNKGGEGQDLFREDDDFFLLLVRGGLNL